MGFWSNRTKLFIAVTNQKSNFHNQLPWTEKLGTRSLDLHERSFSVRYQEIKKKILQGPSTPDQDIQCIVINLSKMKPVFVLHFGRSLIESLNLKRSKILGPNKSTIFGTNSGWPWVRDKWQKFNSEKSFGYRLLNFGDRISNCGSLLVV